MNASTLLLTLMSLTLCLPTCVYAQKNYYASCLDDQKKVTQMGKELTQAVHWVRNDKTYTPLQIEIYEWIADFSKHKALPGVTMDSVHTQQLLFCLQELTLILRDSHDTKTHILNPLFCAKTGYTHVDYLAWLTTITDVMQEVCQK